MEDDFAFVIKGLFKVNYSKSEHMQPANVSISINSPL
jgi:hypothetical protein